MKRIIFLITIFALLNGCAANYTNLYLPDANYLQRREMESRVFETPNAKEMLVASAQVLQDMGYAIKESAVLAGVITAEKNREAGSTTGKVALHALAVLGAFGGSYSAPVYEDVQRFYVSIVVTRINETNVKVRVSFARRSWDNNGKLYAVEKMTDPALYQEFFDKLNQSVFLTEQGI